MTQPALNLKQTITLIAAACALAAPFVSAQQIEGLPAFSSPKAKEFVFYNAEKPSVPAGKRTAFDLQFHVVQGFHINSHRPSSELLIRTELKLDPTTGVTTGDLLYPSGKPYRLGDDTLNVYTGAFAVTVPVEATAGSHAIHGTLRYQACDHAACYPVKSLPVDITIQAR